MQYFEIGLHEAGLVGGYWCTPPSAKRRRTLVGSSMLRTTKSL